MKNRKINNNRVRAVVVTPTIHLIVGNLRNNNNSSSN